MITIFFSSYSFSYKQNLPDKISVPTSIIRVFDLTYSETETLSVKLGEVFIIKLAGNPSTGYNWFIENISTFNRQILLPLNANESGYITYETQPLLTSGFVTGEPEYQEFKFQAKNRGSISLTFVFREIAEPYTEIKRVHAKINVIE